MLPTDKKLRKKIPITTGFLDYFPDATAAAAYVSYVGNLQHNGPDSPLKWTRHLSDDHEDCIGRHMLEKGAFDIDGTRHSAKRLWRAAAACQLEIEVARAKGEPGICAEDISPTPLAKLFEQHKNCEGLAGTVTRGVVDTPVNATRQWPLNGR